MRWLLLVALISCKSEKIDPHREPTESVSASELTFWKWFAEHKNEPTADFGAQLRKIDPGLSYMIRGKELILVGDAAKRVADAAPAIPGGRVSWK